MKYLIALETSGKAGSVAIIDEHGSIDRLKSTLLPEEVGSAQSLAPAIAALLSDSKLNMNSLGCIALITGPGSFTGLRVGVATAKGLAYARKIPIVEIDTLDVIYQQIVQRGKPLTPWVHCLLDAYRGELFVKSFAQAPATQIQPSATYIVDINRFLLSSMSNGVGAEHTFAGPGCRRVRQFLEKEGRSGAWKEWIEEVRWEEEKDLYPRAETVAWLGVAKWREGIFTDPFALAPHYYRGSAAEEKLRGPR